MIRDEANRNGSRNRVKRKKKKEVIYEVAWTCGFWCLSPGMIFIELKEKRAIQSEVKGSRLWSANFFFFFFSLLCVQTGRLVLT